MGIRLVHSQALYQSKLLTMRLGNPGWGKTVLAGSTVDMLHSQTADDLDSPGTVCHYFFRQDVATKASRVEAYRALVTQLYQQTHQSEKINAIFSMGNQKKDFLPLSVRSRASERELLDTLELCLQHVSNPYFVLDGIDECMDASKLVQSISRLCCHTPLRVILFSRPNFAYLRRSVPVERRVILERKILDEDIAQYFDHKLEELLEAGLIPEMIEIESLKQRLLSRAEGMFLWARLMIGYLTSPALTRAQRITAMMESTPEGLDAMYRRIIRSIQKLDQPSRDLASRAFMWIAYGGSPFSAIELKAAIFSDTWDNDENNGAEKLEFALVVSCCGLVEKRSNGYFYFIHLTAQEFLSSMSASSGASDIMLPTRVDGTLRIVASCLSYLLHQVPQQPLSGSLKLDATPEDIRARLPFLYYSSTQWIRLWQNIDDQMFKEGFNEKALTEFARHLSAFLEARLTIMVWIETIYTFQGETCIADLTGLADRLQKYSKKFPALDLKDLQFNLNAFSADMSKLSLAWAKTLELHPQEIWGDVTVFLESRFLVQTAAASLETLAPQLSTKSEYHNPLFSTSKSSSEGSKIAILSIYPSK
jgi:hypothetical protein